MNPLEKIYTFPFTKSIFVYYYSLENSKKSRLEVFLYKNLERIKSSNLACRCALYSVAFVKSLIFIFCSN
jgi:hypothetical protein